MHVPRLHVNGQKKTTRTGWLIFGFAFVAPALLPVILIWFLTLNSEMRWTATALGYELST